MKILIHPFAAHLPSGKPNAKDYPYWEELITELKAEGHEIIQVGVHGEKQLTEDFRPNLTQEQHDELLNEIDLFICVDSWYQHFAHTRGKSGIVLFGVSNPQIFGWKENINLYADKKFFRKYQFNVWHDEPLIPESFVKPQRIMELL